MSGYRPVDLVVGVGSEWGDDAAGLVVVRRLRAAGALVGTAELAGDVTRLLDLWRPADRVAVVDAVRTGAGAGRLHVLDATASPLPARMAPGLTHGLGLAAAVELARALGRLPGRLVIYGVEGSGWVAGTGLSPEVARTVETLVAGLLTLPA